MGRESRLRNPKPESRYKYANGDRKLYDRDAMPEGLDSDVWDLVLCFEQMAEREGYPIPGRPVAYTEFYYRIGADPELGQLLVKDASLYAGPRTTVIYGIRYLDVNLSDGNGLVLYILNQMIRHYWETSLPIDVDYDHCVNNFCSINIFNYLRDYVVDDIKRAILFTEGIREALPDGEIKPSRRTEDQKNTYSILTREYTEKELEEKLVSWQGNS